MKRPDVWTSGFTLRGLPLITQMSGLVDILDIYWNVQDRVLIFTVNRKSHKLFRQGSLNGVKMKKMLLRLEPLLVDLSGSNETLQV